VVGTSTRSQGDAGVSPSDSYAMAGAGMEHFLGHGDQVTARDIAGSEVRRGDVVVLQAPEAVGTAPMLVVKRIIAVAGDELATTPGGELLINGEPVDEPASPPDVLPSPGRGPATPPRSGCQVRTRDRMSVKWQVLAAVTRVCQISW
jgi:signal peptidase I